MNVNYAAVVEFLWDMFETFSRRDCGLILAGYRPLPSEAALSRTLRRLEQKGWIERTGTGAAARFRLSPQATQRHARRAPDPQWNQPWDGKWRAVCYDLPERQRQVRFALWQALRMRKLGLLQRSVWIWPHDLEPILQEVIASTGAPECFIGFEVGKLFLASDAEVVRTAWDWEEISKRQRGYLKNSAADAVDRKSVVTLSELAQRARRERDAYQWALSLDPLLPRSLWPADYVGAEAAARHQTFIRTMRQRWQQLAVS